MLALNIDSMAYGAAAPVGRNGRYKLRLPAGKWALRSSVVELGKPFASFTSAAIVTAAQASAAACRSRSSASRSRERRASRRPRAANINPRNGQAYPGEAFAIETFDVRSADAGLAPMGKAMATMQITELLKPAPCRYTIVEWSRRAAIQDEIALSRTEFIDPAARIDDGNLIDPEILIKGRIEGPARHPGAGGADRVARGRQDRGQAERRGELGSADRCVLRQREAPRRVHSARPDLRPRQRRSARAARHDRAGAGADPPAVAAGAHRRDQRLHGDVLRRGVLPGSISALDLNRRVRHVWTPRTTRRRPSRRPTARRRAATGRSA